MAIAVDAAKAHVVTIYPPTPCPHPDPAANWFPGSESDCDWCAVRPISLVYPLARGDIRFRRR